MKRKTYIRKGLSFILAGLLLGHEMAAAPVAATDSGSYAKIQEIDDERADAADAASAQSDGVLILDEAEETAGTAPDDHTGAFSFTELSGDEEETQLAALPSIEIEDISVMEPEEELAIFSLFSAQDEPDEAFTDMIDTLTEKAGETDSQVQCGAETDIETESETETESVCETESESGTEIESQTETEEESECEEESETEIETESEHETKSETEKESEREAKTEHGIETELESEFQTVTDRVETEPQTVDEYITETEYQTEAEYAAETAIGCETETEIQTEEEPVVLSELQPSLEDMEEVQSESGTTAETETEATPETETETTPESETESETIEDTETVSESETQIETETQSETKAETKTETEPETEPAAETEAETEPMTEPETEPATETEAETEPMTEPETEPAAETEAETETMTQPETEPVTETEEQQASNSGRKKANARTSAENVTHDYTGPPLDLTPYLQSVTLGSMTSDNTFKTSITYQISTQVLNENNTNKLVYQLPEEICATKEWTGNVIDQGTIVGTYQVDTSGNVTIEFTEEYLQGTPSDITGILSFWGRIDESKVDNQDSVTIKFKDEIEKTLTINTGSQNSYDVRVNKTCPSYTVNQDDKTLTFYYQLEITTDKGTFEDITVEDYLQLWGDTSASLNDDVVICKYAANAAEASPGYYGTITPDRATFSGTLTKLEAGEKYIITYSATKQLKDNETGAQLGNQAHVTNTQVDDTSTVWPYGTLYDLSVKKERTTEPVADMENRQVSCSYRITISTTNGTREQISLEDTIAFLNQGNSTGTPYYTVSSVSKVDQQGNASAVSAETICVQDGKLQGTLPGLSAGESYVITYEAGVNDLPEDEKIVGSLKNSVVVNGGVDQTSSSDQKDNITYAGDSYTDWISKSGTYNSNEKKIYWTIILNKDAYGSIDGLTLSDYLDGTEISGEVKLYEKEDNGSESGPYVISLPYTFTNDAAVLRDGQNHQINTSHQFRVVYTTDVDETQLDNYRTQFHNVASIGDHTSETDVYIPKPGVVDKTFVDSTETTINGQSGHELMWKTYLEVPADGFKAGGYYIDTVRDGQYSYSNNQHWFARSLYDRFTIRLGNETLIAGIDYQLTVSGNRDHVYGTGFTDLSISEVTDQDIIKSFKVTFLRTIEPDEGSQVTISYSSFTTSTGTMYNTGTYTQDDTSSSDTEEGKSASTDLIQKMNGNGTTSADSRPISSYYSEDLQKYILTYKLIVNNEHQASGAITISDTLPVGCTLLNVDTWTADGMTYNSGNQACRDGIYFRYYQYDCYQPQPYLASEKDDIYIGVQGINWGNAVSYGYAWEKGVSITSSDNGFTITIPEAAYHFRMTPESGDATDVNLSMAIYYAVEIDPDQLGNIENLLTNTCSVTTTSGQTGHSSVTNSVTKSAIGKTGTYDSDTKTLTYEVDINPQNLTMLDGSGRITVEDTLSYNYYHGFYYVKDVNLKPESLQLVEISDNGTETAATPDSSSLVKDSQNHTATLSITVQDGIHYKLRYQYLIELDDRVGTKEFSIQNKAVISGIADDSESGNETDHTISQGSESTAYKSYATVTLYKRDADNQLKLLSNAQFKLERYTGNGWSDLGIFETDENGRADLGEKLSDDTYRIAYNCAYRLTEEKAPEGYQLSSEVYYFLVSDPNSTTKIVPEGWNTDAQYTSHMLSVSDQGYLFVDDQKQEEEKTDLSVEKVWKNPNGTTAAETPQSVEVKLYRSESENSSEGEEIASVLLNEQNSWHTVFQGLEKYQTDGTPYYYYIREVTIPDGWSVSYSNDKPISGEESDRQITVTNTRKEDTTSVTVRKEWKDINGTTVSAGADQVKISLKRKYQTTGNTAQNVIVRVTVSGKPSQTGAYEEALVTKEISVAQGTQVTVSMISPGFNSFQGVTTFSRSVDASYERTGTEKIQTNPDVWASTEAVTFTVYQDITVTIGNEWCIYDRNSLTLTAASQGSGQTQSGTWVEDENFAEQRILSAANGWQYMWDGLPATHPSGSTYYYYVEEEPVSGCNISYQYDGINNSGQTGVISSGTITVTNTVVQTSVRVEKIWDDDENRAGVRPDGITVKLYRSTVRAEAEETEPQTEEQTDGQSETSQTETSETPSEPEGNRIIVHVYSWNGSTDGTPCNNPKAYIIAPVYIVDDDAGTVELVGTAVLNTENNWEAVVIDQTGTADTKYRLDWRTHGDGTIIKAGSVNLYHEGNGWTPSITGSGVLNMAVTYDTTYQVSRAALVPRETVLTASAASDALVSDLTLTIGGQQVVIPDAEYMGDAADRTLNSANQWKAEWSNLDRTDEKGTLYYYYVVESSVSGYTASYEFTYQGGRADQGIDLVKITNTKEETDTTSITVKKNWSGDLSSSAVYTAEFTLLDSRGEKVTGNGIENPVTLSANGSYIWSDLPPDTYSVQETAAKCNDDSLTSYTTTCQVNGQTEESGSQGSISEGTIVFTNTVRRQGIVLPSTGSGYSIVFYGLGCVFLLISAAWMFLTFKKRNIPVVVGKGGTGSSKT